MVAVVCEVPEAGEEIKSVVEIVDVKREAHILHKELQVIGFKSLCDLDALVRDVYACGIKPMFGQLPREAPFAAGDVQHSAAGGRLQVGEQVLYKFACFELIAVLIEYFVKRRSKPVFIPIHFIFKGLRLFFEGSCELLKLFGVQATAF